MNFSSVNIDTHFPVGGCLPKQPTGALQLLAKHPQYDGRQVIIGIIDTGIDPLANGLQKTTTGDVKVIDLRDSTGSGDVDISTIVKVTSNNNRDDESIQGLSGRKLKIPSSWKNPSGNYHIGIKSLKLIMPSGAFERLTKEYRERAFDPEHRLAFIEAQRRLDEHINKYPLPNEEQKLIREEFQSFVDALKETEKKFNDPGPFLDCIVWNDGDKWIACLDTTQQGDLDQCKCLTNYIDSHEFATFSVIDMVTYSVQIHHEINILEIVVAGGSHGTHVGAISAAYFEDSCEENGVAPGAQLLSINIGDHRLQTMETIPSLVRALKYCIDYKVDIINMSYGEDCHIPNSGRVQDLFNEAVEKHGIIFVSSAGNNGPAISTTGAPGATCTNLIGVAGYVTPEMQSAEFALRESTGCTTSFTWSSRGPCNDGWLGVCISAPGAAITSVPQSNLCQRQLMNGTSMASPNAAGCVALLLSALKQEEIEYNPSLIRRALMNTAQKLDDEFSVGAGLIQIHKALDYIRSLSKPSLISKIQIDITGGQGRGIYLRDFDQVQTSSGDIRLTIRTKYLSKNNNQSITYEDQEAKIKFNCRLSLICDPPVSYVQHGKFLDLAYHDRTFDIRIDPSHLKEDQIHFTELQTFDVNQINAGPLARFPITIIKPIRLNPQSYSLQFNSQTFKTGQIRRHFIEVPLGANIAVFNITNHSSDVSAQIDLHCIQLEFDRSFRLNEFEKIIRLSPHSTFQCYFNVQDKRTLEICLARWWSSLAIIETNYSIEFHSILLSPSKSIHLRSSQSYERFILENRLNNTYEEINGLPLINWKCLVQTLRPNKDESKIQILSKRDCLSELRQIYQLIFVFNFTLLKPSEIQVKCPYLHELLYDNEYEGAFWMCFDTNKQYLGSGDVMKNYSLKLEKGDFVIRMNIRHDKYDLLERLLKDNGGTGLALHIEHKVTGLPTVDFYHSLDSLHLQKKKIQPSTIKLQWGHQVPIYMTTIPEDKLPKVINSTTGTFLRGSITFPKNEKMKKLEMHTIYQYFTEPNSPSSSTSSKKSSSNSTNNTNTKKQTNPPVTTTTTTEEGTPNNPSQKDQQYQEALRDLKISWIPKLIDDQGKLYDEFLNEQQDLSTHIPLHLARLQQLENQLKQQQQQSSSTNEKKDEKLNEIIQFIKEKLLILFDEDSIFKFFGQKNSLSNEKDIQILKTDMEKRRNWLIDIYLSLGNALCDLSIINDEQSTYLTNLIKNLQKHIDINDGKLNNFLYKYYLNRKSYGRAWKLILKQIEEKSSLELDQKLLQLYQTMNMKYLVTYQERLIIAKYPQTYLIMTIDDNTIDIHLTKLVDWLVDRRHCSKDWNERSIAIRAKIQQAILDMPEHDEIKRLLGSSYLDYFCSLKIVEILKETEKESKNMFGMYSSQRMKDWKTIVSSYEKNSVYLVESSQILQRNVAFEIPALKKQIGKCQQIRDESQTRHAELDKNIHEIEKQYSQLCTDMSIKGDNVQRELIQRIEYLPNICTELANEDKNLISSLKSAVEFYREFLKHFHSSLKGENEEYLPILKYLIENGNTTIYQWRTGGHRPVSIERPPLNYKFAEAIEINQEEPNIILGLDDDDLTTSTDGIEVKQTANQSDVIDFDTEAEIDWSGIDTVPELLDPALTSNGNHPNSIPAALREAALNGSTHPIDDGIARGNDALTLLENRSTYTLFIHELYRLQSFIKQRLNEYHVNETILMTFIMQNAPASIQKINENDLKTFLKNVDAIFTSISNRQLDRLFSMRDSYKFVDRLINCFQQKKLAIERNRLQQKELEEKVSNSLKEEQQLKEKLNLLISYTKQLKEQVTKEISSKKCQNRRINIMGEINTL